eukprot:jgi/Tetstr1/452263/TSEL_039299.t1
MLPLSSPEATEYARHGFARRLASLHHAVDRLFEVLPPDLEGIPNKAQLADASAFIQNALVHVYGCLDNLAWLWVKEAGIKKANGADLPASHIGLRPSNTEVVSSLSENFQAELSALIEWFDYVDDYRHALAHRIPLYIPPYSVLEADAATYHDHGAAIGDALTAQDWDAMDEHEAAQEALKTFRPQIFHSLSTTKKSMVFHAQLLADFATVEKIGLLMLEEIESRGSNAG